MILTARFRDALVFASQLHADQVRKGDNTPYIAHLLGVASLVLENGGTEVEAIAALLHDAIEDQGGPAIRERIRSLFGDEVTAIVDGCSDSETIPKPPWRERKVAYLKHLESASDSILLVSTSDKLYNARTILADYRLKGEALWSRFNGGREGSLWYYHSLVEVLSRVFPHPLTEELKRVVAEIEELSRQACAH